MTTPPGTRLVTLGGIMLRQASAAGVRLESSRTVDAAFGGGGANVATALARLGVARASVPSQEPQP